MIGVIELHMAMIFSSVVLKYEFRWRQRAAIQKLKFKTRSHIRVEARYGPDVVDRVCPKAEADAKPDGED